MRTGLSTTQHQFRVRARAGETFADLAPPEAVVVADEHGYALRERHDDRPPAVCAYLLGVARRALDEARSRVRDRTQFGSPLARYQAVAFPLAEHHIRIAGLRLRVLEAATADDGDDELVRLVREEVFEAVEHAVHVHGASGLVRDSTISRCHRAVLSAWQESRPIAKGLVVQRVPDEWSGTVSDVDDSTITDLFAETVARFPERTAVVTDRTVLTYRELDARALRVARALHAEGVARGSVVGIHLLRGPELAAAVLGVLRAGCAYLPLDPEYPAERVRFMIEDSGTPLILTAGWLAEWLPPTTARILCVDRDLPDTGATPLPRAGTGDDPAYLIYTSGSTGTPKGVLVAHRGVVNRLRWDRDRFPLGPEDAVLQHHSLSFDVAVWELFAPLVSGARLVPARPGGAADPDYLTSAVHEHRITALTFVPSLLDVLLDAEPGLAAPSLRYLFSGGEPLSPALCRRVFAEVPGVRLFNFYGPSEATVDVTSWEVTPANVAEGVPIGRPLDNVRAYVLDDFGRPVPVGFTGELYVGGVGVAMGYHNRPALTRSRFLPDPFQDRPGARMYRTGDLVRYRADGALEFVGRVDEQVKVRGFRVEPGEVESALERNGAVRRAVVVAHDPRLPAHVTGNGRTPDVAELRSHLLELLPGHMVPTAIRVVRELPLTPNGKVDRAALRAPAPDPGAPEPADAVTGLMREVLGVADVGPEDDFFSLGGTSLQAARFVTRVRKRLGLDLDLARFLEEPTCRAVLR